MNNMKIDALGYVGGGSLIISNYNFNTLVEEKFDIFKQVNFTV